jgi:hypothetical protein
LSWTAFEATDPVFRSPVLASIDAQDKIRYFSNCALRDADGDGVGEYLGTLQISQDLTRAKALRGLKRRPTDPGPGAARNDFLDSAKIPCENPDLMKTYPAFASHPPSLSPLRPLGRRQASAV